MIRLVTGGAASGKSEWAEHLLLAAGGSPRIYVATMLSRSAEDAARVARHRAMRAKKGFVTVERPLDLAGWECPAGAAVLVECMTNLLANELYEPGGAGKEAPAAIVKGIRRIASRAEVLIIVTGEVFSDGIPYDPDTMRYISMLGKINCEIGKKANVTEVVCGMPLLVKEEQDESTGAKTGHAPDSGKM